MQGTPWIIHTKAQPKYRLFCFPYAGGGASIYRLWSSKLPATIEVCPIQLPGRENRMLEPPITRLPALIEELARVLAPVLDTPYVIFGHSMGALISFELTRYLRKQQLPLPQRLLLSARRAPQLPRRRTDLHNQPDAEFIASLRTLGGTPEAILQHEELMQMMLPTLRADFTLYETYVYSDDAPLACPITIFGGEQDSEVSIEDLEQWRIHTRAAFRLQLFPGTHFFLHSCQDQLLQAIRAELAVQ